MEQRVLNIVVVVLLVGIIGVSSVAVIQQMSYQSLDSEYQDLLADYEILSSQYDEILGDYDTLFGQYQSKVAEYDQLNNTYTALLAIHDELLDSYERTIQTLLDTTLELSALNQTYLDLLADFEELNVTYYILTGEYDALNATYQILLQQHNQLNTTYFDLLDSYDILQGEYDSLSVTYYQLLSEHENLQADYDQLLSDFNTLQGEYDTLLADYTQLQADHDALQSDYDNLWLNYNTLWAAHQALQNDYDALQANYVTLQGQYNQLQTDYDSLEQDYLNLQTEYDMLDASYWILQGEYDVLQAEYDVLLADYEQSEADLATLQSEYDQLQTDYNLLYESMNTLATWIRQQILPAQYMVFAEAVRRYYFEDFYVQNKWYEGNISGYWTEFVRYMRDVVIHDSQVGRVSVADKNVFFDESHSQFISTDGYTRIVRDLTGMGFNVLPMTTFSPSLLAACDVFVVSAANDLYTSDEIDAIESFVSAGGSLFVLTDWIGFGDELDPIIERFGVFREKTGIEDSDDNLDGNSLQPYFDGDNIKQHPINKGVKDIWMYGGSGFVEIPESAQPLIVTDTDGTATFYGGGIANGVPIAVVLNVGDGKVAMIGDTSIMIDTHTSSTYRVGYTRRANAMFLLNTILWLADAIEGSYQSSLFGVISEGLANALKYGNETSYLAFDAFYSSFDWWIPNWGSYNLYGDFLIDLNNTVQWCIDNIDYEYDSDITRGQEPYAWDYIKFPVETAFRTMGDCEDQAMLTAAYLESCGFEAMVVVIHDPEWNNGQGLYHGVPMVWWDNTWGARTQTGFYFGSNDPMPYGEGWWVFLDTTWDTPFGTDPAWLQWYAVTDINRVFNYEVFSYAVCDYNGWVSYAPFGGAGSAALEAYVP